MQSVALVVGAGPVGLTMAAELTRYGVRTRIIDKAAERTDKSKALVLWSRTLELMDRSGCGESFVIADVGNAQTDQRRPDPTLPEVQEVMNQRGPGGIEASAPIWLASFRINERKVSDYRAGRVFLAGDAAHIHSPAGGQGMNTGMQDACNLAWKLALVQGERAAAEPLLSSYSIERSAVGHQVLVNAGRLTTLATLRSTVWQEVRNRVASLVFGLSPVRATMANTLAELSIGYPNSPLTIPGGHRLTGPAPGERAPVSTTTEPVEAKNTPRFTLCVASDSAATVLPKRYPDLLEPEIQPPFDEHGVWLIRPDGYVALAVADEEWHQVESYFGRICGQSN